MPDLQMGPSNGSAVASKQIGRPPLHRRCERIILRSVYFIPGLSLKISSCSRLDRKGMTTTINKGVCCLSDSQDGVVFAKIDKTPTDACFVTTVMSHSRKTVASYRPEIMRNSNHRTGTASTLSEVCL